MCRGQSATCKKSKELDDNSLTKNDTKDAKVIVQLVKGWCYSEPTLPESNYAKLGQGMKFYDKIVSGTQCDHSESP